MTWIDDVREFCEFYNIPLEHIAETLYEPKVIPMIRGKAFEFTVLEVLKRILPEDEFEVSKQVMNAQIDSHDVDILVLHIPSQTRISVECKLAGKETYRYEKADNRHSLRVKCMRSRTLGKAMLDQQSTKLRIDRALLEVHNDSYLPTDFDIVFTSIANAFYVTNEDGIFDWGPTEEETQFLKQLTGSNSEKSLKNLAFQSMYLAVSYDLAILQENENLCSRQKCSSKENCGFIPNYPSMFFLGDNQLPEHPWYAVTDAVSVFRRVADRKAKMP